MLLIPELTIKIAIKYKKDYIMLKDKEHKKDTIVEFFEIVNNRITRISIISSKKDDEIIETLNRILRKGFTQDDFKEIAILNNI